MQLGVDYLGVHFENPFLLASGPPAADAEMLLRAFECGWSGAVTKTLIARPVNNVRNRFAALKAGDKLVAFQNFELLSEQCPDEWYRDIRRLKREFPQKVIVGSIMGDARSADEWTELALGLQDAGTDLLELNFSCPHGYPDRGEGASIGQSAEFTAEIVSWLANNKEIRIPLVPKLTAATGNISHIGQSAANAGAAGLSAINTLPSFMGFDLRTLAPRPNVGGFSTTGGCSGPGIKPIALRCIYELSKRPNLPLMAGGGIFSGYDAAEFILLGASLVQVCTAVMFSGYEIFRRLQQELDDFMGWHGFASIAEFAGAGCRLVTAHDALDRGYAPVARVDRLKCTGCKACITACRDAAFQALYLSDGKAAVDANSCAGCGLCVHVCPPKAIELTE